MFIIKFWLLPGWLWEKFKSFESFERLGKVARNEDSPSIIIDIVKAMLQNKIVRFALIFLAIFYLIGIVAVLGEIFHFSPTPYDYEQIDYNAVRAGPSWAHWFGTDLIGRDVLTRVFFSMGTCVGLTILVALFSTPPGVILGLIAGYFGGWKDWLIMRTGEVLSAVPAFFMFLFITVSLRSRYDDFFYSLGGFGEYLLNAGVVDFSLIMLVMAMFFWVGSARIIRSETLKLREMPYVDAARALGAPPLRIILRHILPNIAGIIALWMFSVLGAVVIMEVGLSWLGLGIRPPHPSFGVLFSEVRDIRLLDTSPHLLIFPGIIVSLFIYSFFFLEMKLNLIIQTLYSKGSLKK